MILAKNLELTESFKSNRNVLLLGVPGSGKTRGHVLPNLMEMDSSFVVLDPKGDLYSTASQMLQYRGYRVQCVDFNNPFSTTDFYNPLLHIHSEDDIVRFTELLVAESRNVCNDVFWPNSSQVLANALVGYLVDECNEDDCTLSSILKLLRQMTFIENQKSTLDIMFEEVKKRSPDSFAVEQYEVIKTVSCAEKTFTSIIISLATTFTALMSKGIKHLTHKNTIDFRKLGHQKTALFVINSDTDRSKDALVNILFQQAIDELCRDADCQPGHCLPVHVHFFLDDFGTNLTINRFDAAIAGMRSREMSCSVILQSEGQLKKMYGDAWPTILGSCAAYVFLGSNDINTCHDVSLRINKPLDQVLYKRNSDIFVFVQGKRPEKVERYDLVLHELYCKLNDTTPGMGAEMNKSNYLLR